MKMAITLGPGSTSTVIWSVAPGASGTCTAPTAGACLPRPVVVRRRCTGRVHRLRRRRRPPPIREVYGNLEGGRIKIGHPAFLQTASCRNGHRPPPEASARAAAERSSTLLRQLHASGGKLDSSPAASLLKVEAASGPALTACFGFIVSRTWRGQPRNVVEFYKKRGTCW